MMVPFERYKQYYDLCKRIDVNPIPYKLGIDYDEHWDNVTKLKKLDDVCTCCGTSKLDRIRIGHDTECQFFGQDPTAACYRLQLIGESR